MARGLERVEIWTDVQCNGGTRLCVVPDVISVVEEFEVGLGEICTVTMPRLSTAWSEVEHRRVLRVVLTDGDYTEWRIAPRVEDALDQQGGLLGKLRCESIKYDLGVNIIERIEADGRAHGVFTLLDMTPEEHVDFAMGYAPAYLVKGSVEPTTERDLQYDNDSPQSSLSELAALAGAELEVVRNGTTNYQVYLRNQIGASATKAYLRAGKNIHQVRRRSKADIMANRVFPVGATQSGAQATMADAVWEVQSVVGSVVTLVGAPMVFDDQLNGTYLRKTSGLLTQVTDSAAPGSVTVTDPSGIAPGNLVSFRRNATGDQLTYLDDPASIALYGKVERVVRRTDIPLIENLLANPLLNQWSGGSPVSWSPVGAPSISENTDELYTRFGGSSAHVTAAQDEGIISDALTIAPTATRPHFSAQISLRIISGTVMFRFKDATNVEYYPGIDSEDSVRKNITDRWIDRLAVEGIDLQVVGCTSVQLEVIAVGGPAEFYLDAGQVEQRAEASPTFLGGRASVMLWEAARDWMEDNSQPLEEFEVDVADLERLYPDVFQYDELVLGGTVQVVVPDLDLDFSTRIKKIVRDVGLPGVSRIELSSRLEDLSGRLGTPGRRPREELEKETGTSGTATFKNARAYINADGDLIFSYRLNLPVGLSIAYAWDTTAQPTRKEVIDATHLNYATQDSAQEDELLIAPAVATNPEDHVYLTVVAFSGANVTGFPGEMFQEHLRVSVSGGQIADGSVVADKLTDQAKRFTTDVAFSSSAPTIVDWGAGSMILSDGSAYTISANNTGVMTGITYIYFDKTVSTTALQVSTDYANASGENVILVCVAKPATLAGERAYFVPGVGVFGLNSQQLSPYSVGVTHIQDNAVWTQKLIAEAVTAAKIATGAVEAAKIAAGAVETDKLAANSVTAAKINVIALSAIAADLGTVTAGYIQNAGNTAAIRLSGTATLPSTNYLDFTATGSSPFLKHSALTLGADGSVTFGSGVVTASAISVASLSAIAADLGTVTAGYIQNAGNTAAIRLSGTATLPSTNYLDFTATGSSPFLKHSALTLEADGDAVFTGSVTTTHTLTGTDANFSGDVTAKGGTGTFGGVVRMEGDGNSGMLRVTLASQFGPYAQVNIRARANGGYLCAYDDATSSGDEVIAFERGPKLGFLGATAVVRQNVTGSRGGNTALASLLAALGSLGLITNSTT